MTPWTAETFRKHNREATKAQLKVGAGAANRALKKGASDGTAVHKGNAAIKAMRSNAKKTKKRNK